MIISCIGDSLTEGDYGIKNTRCVANVQPENYPYFLSLMMKCEVRNYGKCGIRSTGMLKLYEEGLIDVRGSDIVLVMLGTNGGQSKDEDTPDNEAYMRLLECIRRDAPAARVILITPPEATVNPEYSNCGYMPQVLEAQAFTRLAAERTGLELIDITRAFPANQEHIYRPNDGLHFCLVGYMRLAQIIYSRIARYRALPVDTVKTDTSVKLIAHRGLSGLECENTAASFTAAGNRRAYCGIETDIWKTKNGMFVCSHDSSTKRLCGTALSIPDTDFEELRALRLNDIDRATPCGQYVVPTLEEYVRICKKYSKHAVAELKADFSIDDIKAISSVFAKYDYLENTTFISFKINNLDLIRQILPSQSCQFLTSAEDPCDGWYKPVARMLEERGMDIDMDWYAVTKEAVDCFHSHGIKVNVWTVDNPECAKYLESCGVDYITTNILERSN